MICSTKMESFKLLLLTIVLSFSIKGNALENEPVEDYIEELDLRVDCPGHTLCLSTKGDDCGSDSLTDNQLSEKDKTKLLKLHNDYRSKFASGSYGFPKAANMMKLSWSEDLAQIAQRWSDQCIFDHDEMSARATEKFAHVGQNVYLQKISKKVPGIPFKGVKKWFDEIKKFDAKQINPFAFTYNTGHFTQIAWATTTEIGCGWSNFMDGSRWKRILVCNYGSGGNVIGKSMYEEGDPCSKCPSQSSCQESLCT